MQPMLVLYDTVNTEQKQHQLEYGVVDHVQECASDSQSILININ